MSREEVDPCSLLFRINKPSSREKKKEKEKKTRKKEKEEGGKKLTNEPSRQPAREQQ